MRIEHWGPSGGGLWVLLPLYDKNDDDDNDDDDSNSSSHSLRVHGLNFLDLPLPCVGGSMNVSAAPAQNLNSLNQLMDSAVSPEAGARGWDRNERCGT